MMRKWVLALAVTMSALFSTGNAYAERRSVDLHWPHVYQCIVLGEHDNVRRYRRRLRRGCRVRVRARVLAEVPTSKYPFWISARHSPTSWVTWSCRYPLVSSTPTERLATALVIASVGSDVPDEFLGTNGAFNFGFGAKIFFSRSIGLRFDYRRFAIQTGDEDPDLGIPFTGIKIEASPDLNRFVGGVTFRF